MSRQNSPEDSNDPGTAQGEDNVGFGEEDEDSGFASNSNETPARQGGSRPRGLNVIRRALDDVFVMYQEQHTDYPDLAPREAFTKDMMERGVEFPGADKSSGANFSESPGVNVRIAGGQGGGECTATDNAVDFNGGFLSGHRSRRHGLELTTRAEREDGRFERADREVVQRIADTDDIQDRLRQAAPEHAKTFVEAQNELYDPLDMGGAGNNAPEKGLWKLLDHPKYLKWALQSAIRTDRSIVEVAAFLGGGTGNAFVILFDELARLGLFDSGNASLGFVVGKQMGRVANDVHLGTFPDGSDRFTFDDAHGTAARLGDRISTGDADWAIWMENPQLTYSFWALRNNPDYNLIRDFNAPMRFDADPKEPERRIGWDPRFRDYSHTQRDRVWTLSTFTFRRLVRREPTVSFSVGAEDYDHADFETDFHEFVHTTAFDGVHSWDELEDRNIPDLRGVHNHIDALHGLSHTAPSLVNSPVSYDEMEGAQVVIFAPGIDISLGDLQAVESEVARELRLASRTADSREKPVRAISMELEGGVDQFPGNYAMAMSVFIRHSLPLDAHERMATSEYRQAVTQGVNR